MAVLILIILGFTLCVIYSDDAEIDIKMSGTTVQASTLCIPFIHKDAEQMNEEIVSYASHEMYEINSTPNSIKKGVSEIAESYGYNDVEVNIESEFGEDVLPILFQVKGTSMVPTFQNGEKVIAEKTNNISVGDCVVANHPDYGLIVKRVAIIDEDQVYLISDNKQVSYEYHDNYYYKIEGLKTWINRDRIIAVVKIGNVSDEEKINF